MIRLQLEKFAVILVVLTTNHWVDTQCTSTACATNKEDNTCIIVLDGLNRLEQTLKTENTLPRDCKDLRDSGHTTSTTYTVYYLEGNAERPVRVFCDMETDGGGWLVFQRRIDGEINFDRNWADYFNFFGELDSEFWLGNYNIHMLSNQKHYTLRIDLQDFDGEKRFAEYQNFNVSRPRDKFRLNFGAYSGTAGDSLGSGHQFSTRDADHDKYPNSNCAGSYTGGWWFGQCHGGNLNALYLKGNHTSYANGVNWNAWRGYYYSLKISEMKFRPT